MAKEKATKDQTTKEIKTKDKDEGRKHFGVKDVRLICDWLDEPGNLDNLLGTEGKTKIGGKQSTKKQAFESMAEFINERQFKGSTLVKMNFQLAKNRFNHITTKYKRTKQASEVTGFGLTDANEADGVHTIKDKLESMCHCYETLDNIFGDKPEIDIAANLFLSELTSKGDGTSQSDFLTEHDSSPSHTPLIDLDAHLENNIAAAKVEELPTTPLGSGAAPCQLQTNEELCPSDVGPSANAAPSPESDGPSRPTTSISQKHRLETPGSKTAAKKHSIEKVPSLAGSFATSMDSFSQGKLKSLEMKEKAMEHRTATQALRAKTAQQQLQISQQHVGFEALWLKLEERKMEEDMATRAREFAAAARARKVQARIDVIKSNVHRSPVELAKIIAPVESLD